MWNLNLLRITALLLLCGCLADAEKYLYVGGQNNNCNNTIVYDVYKDWEYYIVWNGENFQSPCNFVFQITNMSIPYDDEQQYSVCVHRNHFEKRDSSTWFTCKMYSPPYGTSEISEGYECFKQTDKKNKGNEEKESVCADINEVMNVSFTTIYGLTSNTPSSFQKSEIKLKVYAKWNMPLPIILAIVFGSIGFCALVTIVIIVICVVVVNKHHKSRREAQLQRMAQYNQGTAVQYQPNQTNQPVYLQSQSNYATPYGQGQAGFQYGFQGQYGVQNSAFQNDDKDLQKKF
ncbi:hypothetical protein KUTeg_021191 [Tegillarca granosa]|uniref:Transmembrane protein n=1 Tax=Tegillarca granosa TaxID=220873 RepID=A0ABQ9ECF8_TEGGR|nr:hypothetical protein KUTeg_021191 [Tegillarca granosa]